MAVLYGGFWWAAILGTRLGFAERRPYKIIAHQKPPVAYTKSVTHQTLSKFIKASLYGRLGGRFVRQSLVGGLCVDDRAI